jgi:hypothetical protein
MAKRRTPKIEVIDILNEHLLNRTPFPVSWNCTYCQTLHAGDLLKRVQAIDQPDAGDDLIKLIGEAGKLFGVINISKNKTLNKKFAEHYGALDAIYIQFNPFANGANIATCLASPEFVDTCLNPKCKNCAGYKKVKSLWVIDSSCWKCKHPMKVAVLDCNGFHGGPDRFNDQELALARSKGAIIQNNYSKTIRNSYLSNTCLQCNNFAGDHFLFTDNYCEAMYGQLPYETTDLGFSCNQCD